MARDFDGTTGYLSAASAPVLTEPLTLAGWFKSAALTLNQAIIKVGKSAGSAGWQLWYTSNNNQVAATAVDEAQTASAAFSVVPGYTSGVWTHGAAVFYSSTSRAAFMNGGQKGTDPDPITVSGVDSMLIGARYLGGSLGSFAVGHLAEVGVWNVALTDAEVAALATGLSPLLIRPTALVAYAPIFGRASPEQDLMRAQTLTVEGTAPQAAHPRIIYPGSAKRIVSAAVAAPATSPWFFQHQIMRKRRAA